MKKNLQKEVKVTICGRTFTFAAWQLLAVGAVLCTIILLLASGPKERGSENEGTGADAPAMSEGAMSSDASEVSATNDGVITKKVVYGNPKDEDVRAAAARWLGYELGEIEFGYPTHDGKWRRVPYHPIYDKVGDHMYDDVDARRSFASIWGGLYGEVYVHNDDNGEVAVYDAATGEFKTVYENVETEWPLDDSRLILVKLVDGDLTVIIPETAEERFVASGVSRVCFGKKDYVNTFIIYAINPGDGREYEATEIPIAEALERNRIRADVLARRLVKE